MHSNAKLTPRGRKEMVRRVLSGERLGDVSQGYGVSPRTVRKWMARYRAEGADGLRDRSSRPHKLRCLLGEVQLSKVRALRQRRMTGDAISRVLNQNRATIYRRYRQMGIVVKRVMTDNGPCYLSRLFRAACNELGLRHIRTRPYTPRTNGKAERFIRTALKEWAYATAYTHSNIRTKALSRWLHRYNNHRPHSALGDRTPAGRLAQRGTTCWHSTASHYGMAMSTPCIISPPWQMFQFFRQGQRAAKGPVPHKPWNSTHTTSRVTATTATASASSHVRGRGRARSQLATRQSDA